MRKVKLVMTAGVLFSLACSVCIIHNNASARQADEYQKEQMILLQNGDTAIPTENYSFDAEEAENMPIFLSASDDLSQMQQDAALARENNNATLQERKEKCARALYNGMIALDKQVEVAEFALTREEFKEVITDVVNSNPELFYIGKTYSVKAFPLSDEDETQIVDYCTGFYEYQDGGYEPQREKIRAMIQEVENKRDEILSEVLAAGMTRLEKMLVIHDYIILHSEYDYSNYLKYLEDGDTSVFDPSVYNIYGMLTNGKAVCQGYALTYKYLLEAAGIDDIGFASNDSHVWNTVTIDSENYYVDCTWDDSNWDTLGNVKYTYFMKNEDNLINHDIKDTDRECNGVKYSDMFWKDVDSGIFYYQGSYYYIGDDGNLYKTKLRNDSDIAAGPSLVEELELQVTDSWNYNNGAKLALKAPSLLYHDSKNIYAYDLKTHKKKLIFTPILAENELIYGLSYQQGQFLYATRMQTVSDGTVAYNNTEQKKYRYTLPDDLFYVPVEFIQISGNDTIYLSMENGKLISDKVDLKVSVLPENATNKRMEKWISSDTSIAVVDINGRVKGVAPGIVTITAQSYDGVVSESFSMQVIYNGPILNDSGDTVYYQNGNIIANQFYQAEDGNTYYLGENGIRVTGWQEINGKQYYFDASGIYTTGWKDINGKCYYFDKNGVMLTGWQEIGGVRYYLDKNGVMLTGWQNLQGRRYYFGASGTMAKGWQTIASNRYYFDDNGIMLTGWKTIKGKKYYLDDNGVMTTGWKTIEKKKYYFNKKGVMATGWKTIKKKKYYFSKKGVMTTGWKTIKKKKYYFNKKGVMATGWKTIKKKKYYFNKKGVMVKGLQKIDGISYYFARDGHLVS